MIQGIFSSASALNSATVQHEVVSNNLANLNVSGFKRTLLAFEELSRGNAGQAEPSGLPSQQGNLVSKFAIDFSQGDLRTTGRSLDIAIQGNGFFTVQGPQQDLYTRNGYFHIDENRTLVTGDGYPVLAGGSEIQIPAGFDASQLKVTSEGTLLAGEIQLGQLDLVGFERLDLLKSVGSANFSAPAEAIAVDEPGGVFVQGSLETANTKAVYEMIQLITGSRHFESAQRALRTISDSLEKLTNNDQ